MKTYQHEDLLTGLVYINEAPDANAARLMIPWAKETNAYRCEVLATHYHVEVLVSAVNLGLLGGARQWRPMRPSGNAQPYLFDYEEACRHRDLYQRMFGHAEDCYRVVPAGVVPEPL